MLKNLSFLLFIIFISGCIQVKDGGFSKDPSTIGAKIADQPGENLFFQEEANILQFFTDLEAATPDSYFSSDVNAPSNLDNLMAICNSNLNTIKINTFGKFQEGSNSYQTLFSPIGNPSFYNVNLDFDLTSLKFVGLYNLDYSPINNPISATGLRMVVQITYLADSTLATNNFHLVKLVSGSYVLLGAQGGLATYGSNCP